MIAWIRTHVPRWLGLTCLLVIGAVLAFLWSMPWGAR